MLAASEASEASSTDADEREAGDGDSDAQRPGVLERGGARVPRRAVGQRQAAAQRRLQRHRLQHHGPLNDTAGLMH